MAEFSGILAGVGDGIKRYWLYTEHGNFLSAYGIINKLTINFNLSSEEDIYNKFEKLKQYQKDGVCTENEVTELEEKVRTLSNFVLGGNSTGTNIALGDSISSCIVPKGVEEGVKYKKDQITTVYRDGKEVKVKHRGSRKGVTSPEVERACAKAREYAHTPQAEAKRRKSINARRDGKVLGNIK